MSFVNGAMRFGFAVPWYFELDEEHIINNQLPNAQRDLLHYYKHTKRLPGTHNITPTMIPGGTHKVIDVLHFGTQINEFRYAT